MWLSTLIVRHTIDDQLSQLMYSFLPHTQVQALAADSKKLIKITQALKKAGIHGKDLEEVLKNINSLTNRQKQYAKERDNLVGGFKELHGKAQEVAYGKTAVSFFKDYLDANKSRLEGFTKKQVDITLVAEQPDVNTDEGYVYFNGVQKPREIPSFVKQ